MDLLQSLKIAGLAVAAISAFVTLFGSVKKEGKITSLGWVAVVCIVAGLLTSLDVEIYQRKEAAQEARANQEWEFVLSEPIESIELEFYVTGRAELSRFAEFTNLTKVTIADTRSRYTDASDLRFHIVEDEDVQARNLVKLAAYPLDAPPNVSEEDTEIFILEVKNGALRGVHDYSKQDYHLNTKICGLAAKLPWANVALSEIKTVRDIFYMDVSFRTPHKFDFSVDLLGKYEPEAFFGITFYTPTSMFELTNTMITLAEVMDQNGPIGMAKTVSGRDIAHLFKKQFFAMRSVYQDSLSDDTKLHERTGTIEEFRRVVHFGKPN